MQKAHTRDRTEVKEPGDETTPKSGGAPCSGSCLSVTGARERGNGLAGEGIHRHSLFIQNPKTGVSGGSGVAPAGLDLQTNLS